MAIEASSPDPEYPESDLAVRDSEDFDLALEDLSPFDEVFCFCLKKFESINYSCVSVYYALKTKASTKVIYTSRKILHVRVHVVFCPEQTYRTICHTIQFVLKYLLFGKGYLSSTERQVKSAYEPSGPSGRSLSRVL